MHFKGQAKNSKVFSSLNLIIGVCLISAVLILAREYVKDDEGPSVITKEKAVVRQKISSQEEIKSSHMVRDTDIERGREGEENVVSSMVDPGDGESKNSLPRTLRKDEEGVHRVRKGECLQVIAAREDVYGDPLKWPSLYRLNRDKFPGGEMEAGADLHIKELPEGMSMGFVKEEEARENARAVGDRAHVVNVLSALEPGKVVRPAAILMNNGYRVYISRARVKGQDWLRLRAGFFTRRSEAEEARERIASLLKMDGAWIDFIEGEELKESAGY